LRAKKNTNNRLCTREKEKSEKINNSLKIFLITAKEQNASHPDSRQCFVRARKQQINLSLLRNILANFPGNHFSGVGWNYDCGTTQNTLTEAFGVNSSIQTIHYAIEPNATSASHL
jgi:hypothetical protein